MLDGYELKSNKCIWKSLPCFLLRSAGFSFDWLTSLNMPNFQHNAELLLEQDDIISKLQKDFQDKLFPQILEQQQSREPAPAIFRYWYRLNGCVQKRRPVSSNLQESLTQHMPEICTWIQSWNSALSHLSCIEATFQQEFDMELMQVRDRLHGFAGDLLFQEALFLSNPNMYSIALSSYLHHYNPEKRPSKIKYQERQLYAYLQRLCARNDTTSFFGPIDYGWCDDKQKARLLIERLPQDRSLRRLTRLSYWAAQALADLIAEDELVTPFLVPRLQDGCILHSDGEFFVTPQNRRIRLPKNIVSTIKCMDGHRTVGEICQLIGNQRLVELQTLAAEGLLILKIAIPTATFDPLGWLIDWITNLPASCSCRVSWLERLNQLKQHLSSFPSMTLDEKISQLKSLEDRFKRWTNLKARRGEGQIYADRLMIFDEAQGEIASCTLGSDLQRELIEQLGPTLDLCASYSMLLQEVCRDQAIEVFKSMVDGDRVPYLAFVRRLDSTVTLKDCLSAPSVHFYRNQLQTFVQNSKKSDGTIRITAANLNQFYRPIAAGTMISPDILLRAPDLATINEGRYQIVLGEIHHGAQVWCHFLTFFQKRDELAQTLENLLELVTSTKRRANIVYGRTQGKVFISELPGLSAELRGRSLKPAYLVFPAAELEVGLDSNGAMVLYRHNQAIELYPGDPRAVSNWIFGTPPVVVPSIELGPYTPRIEIDHLVVQRATWLFSTSEWMPIPQTSSRLMLHSTRIRKRHRLPRMGFVRLPNERKPFYVDFGNILAVEFFFSMIKNSRTFRFSEMLPTEGDLWLNDSIEHRTCEWRMTAIYSPPQ